MMLFGLIFVASVLDTSFAEEWVVSKKSFPKNFKFGLATAAYQIEGGWNADGKGPSNWDHECHTYPEKFYNQTCADVASDSYHKYKEDVEDLKWLGAQVYRFSISWPRILPTGSPDNINRHGVEYYKNLIAALKQANIEPFPTMFHYDTPQALEELGGWTNDSIVDLFAEYARILFRELGDDVKRWTTVNEPLHVCVGYGESNAPPNKGQQGVSVYTCGHNIIKAHAKVYHMYQNEFKASQGGQVSIVIDTTWFQPGSDKLEDIEAAERALQFAYGWFANPVVFGNYPQVMIDRVGFRSKNQGYNVSRLPEFTIEEQEYIKDTVDFMCINTYSTNMVNATVEEDFKTVNRSSDIRVTTYQLPEWESTASSWRKVVPWGLRKLTTWVSTTYNNPEILITENGYVDSTGTLNDTDTRIHFHKLYMSNLLDSMYEDSANVTGYMIWSLMDNFEWYSALSRKLGLFNVDFNSLDMIRTPKDSAYWYKNVCNTKCLVEFCDD